MMSLFTFGSALPISTITVALPEIANDLGLSAKTLSWIPLIFLLASVILVLPCGRIADLYGRIRVFLTSIWFVIASATAIYFVQSDVALLALRFCQGAGAAVGFVLLVSIVSSAVEKQSRGKAFGVVASAMYFGLTAGPLIGGYLVTHLSWRWTFLAHMPFMVAALFIGYRYVDSEWRIAKGERFDWQGSLAYAAGVVLVTTGVLTLPNYTSTLAIVGGIMLLYGFVYLQRTSQHPLVNINLFKHNRIFAYSCLTSIFMYAANFSSLILVSLHLQYLRAMPADTTGWVLMISPLSTALVTPTAGIAADRFEPKYIVTIGISLTALGLFLLCAIQTTTDIAMIVIAMVSLGVGFALFAPVNAHAIMASVGDTDIATAAAAHASVRLIGQLVSMATVSLIFAIVIGQAQIAPENYPRLADALKYCFLLAGVICLPAYYYSLNRGRILS